MCGSWPWDPLRNCLLICALVISPKVPTKTDDRPPRRLVSVGVGVSFVSCSSPWDPFRNGVLIFALVISPKSHQDRSISIRRLRDSLPWEWEWEYQRFLRALSLAMGPPSKLAISVPKSQPRAIDRSMVDRSAGKGRTEGEVARPAVHMGLA